MKYVLWAVAVVFAVGVAAPIYFLTGFGLGPRSAWDKILYGAAALGFGIGSQIGLALAPVVRSKGWVPRAIATVLMVPALVVGLVSYGDVLAHLARVGTGSIDRIMVLSYLTIVPVYVAVGVWMWREPRPPADE